MKIMMINGSPRRKDSNSMYLLKGLTDRIGIDNDIRIYNMSDDNDRDEVAGKISEDDVLVIAFPLYVDGIPSNLLGVLRRIELEVSEKIKGVKVYVIVNNGFYDALQNRIAIDMMWKWCEKCRFERGCAVAVGAGEMLKAAPLGRGPSTNAGNALDKLADNILKRASQDNAYVEPNFPRPLYILAAHAGWRKQAKRNGLKAKDIKSRAHNV